MRLVDDTRVEPSPTHARRISRYGSTTLVVSTVLALTIAFLPMEHEMPLTMRLILYVVLGGFAYTLASVTGAAFGLAGWPPVLGEDVRRDARLVRIAAAASCGASFLVGWFMADSGPILLLSMCGGVGALTCVLVGRSGVSSGLVRVRRDDACGQCGYRRHGGPMGRCPECGRAEAD